MTQFIEHLVFANRKLLVAIFALATLFLGYQASQMRLDAGFEKNIPLNHEYMKTYIEHRKDFGGANNILVSVCDKDGDIFNTNFFDTLKNVHDQLFFINGVNRSLVVSLFSPSTRFTEFVEGGFAGGPVFPADFGARVFNVASLYFATPAVPPAPLRARVGLSNRFSVPFVRLLGPVSLPTIVPLV